MVSSSLFRRGCFIGNPDIIIKMAERKPLGELLLSKGIIREEDLKKALEEQKKTGVPLGQILIDMGLVSPDVIGKVLGEQYGVSYKKISDILISPDVVNLIPESIVKEKKIFPVRREGDTLEVAILPPVNPLVIDEIRDITGLKIKPFVVTDMEFQRLLNQYFNIKTMASKTLGDVKVEEERERIVPETPIVKFVNSLIEDAINQNASDIHFDPEKEYTRVRYRIDGMLVDVMTVPKGVDDSIISRVKVLSGMDIAEKRRAQDGRFSMKIHGKEYDFRVSSIGTRFGEKLEMRILNKAQVLIELERLGMLPSQQKIFEKIVSKPYGMVLVTGPTGSGKTTTLYSTLNKLNTPEKSIVTIEDPIEYELKGIVQIQVNPKAGITFSTGLRSLLRLDPDIIMVGEIRDLETAKIAFEAALTGHLVLSTIHTNDAPSTLVRLIDLGIEPYLVSSVVIGVVAQRLVRTICPVCKIDYKPSREEMEILFGEVKEDVLLKKGKGCSSCNFTGYKGRTGVFEILPITRRIREIIKGGESSEIIRMEAEREGMISLIEAGFEKVKMGITTLEEVLRVIRLEE